MKTKTILIGSLLLLMTLFAASLIVMQTTGQIPVDVRITPFNLNTEDEGPNLFRVTIKVPASSGKTTADIDPTSVTVEGLSMVPTPEDWEADYKVTKNFFAFMVNGGDLYDIIFDKATHMGPSPGEKVGVPITVTGEFMSDGAFVGTCTVYLATLLPDVDPPPL